MNSPVSLDRNTPLSSMRSQTGTMSPQKSEHVPDPYEDDDYGSDPEDDSKRDTVEFSIQGKFVAPRAEILTIRELHSLIHEGMIDLNPPYQRDVVWPAQKQALLIDSLFRNFWIPPVVFAVTQDEDGVPTRFLDGQLPYVQSKKRHWFYTCPESSQNKLQLPDKVKNMFDQKQITCVEYSDLTPAEEREIFQRRNAAYNVRVSSSLHAVGFIQFIYTVPRNRLQLTPRGPNGYRNSKANTYVRLSPPKFMASLNAIIAASEGGLSFELNWDTKRGRQFQNVAHFVYCCDGYPGDENVPTRQKMDKWLSRTDPPGEQFKHDINEALTEFGRIAANPSLRGFATVAPRMAPIEFVFIGVLIYVLRKATTEQRARAMYYLRADIRAQHTDIRFNTAIGAGMWQIIRHLKHSPTASSRAAIAGTPKRRRRMSDADDDDEYHPSGKNGKSRSRRG
ncbi:hypothetical protein MVEN_01238300 [Mycena venus]|uniref:DUF262 domain-containing protein n=1 Tax=Mycena venus TaxID=2733690 RepID=A0A8H7CYL9_9AGAR|nr:hypothetical protein MVEN_01238300 [Mycena venus]